ncbi:TonB-dependent receptor domain-containing protein [Sandarakinorhabdus sp.]|uniref:TonB-dependent receptor domain-containing protein n=1 Tax=Sandarakinorhabdus sp. TaxID=1916663 RepID=UPI00286D9EC3|nr:TonB-dependent receptor [Sandarakinorhabdus sp.]
MATAYLGATAASAQSVQTADTEADAAEIIVTGSFIRGSREDAAVPVDVFKSDELIKQGISSPLEFIKQLPSVGAVLGDSNQFSTASQGFQGNGSINLRGLGPTRTLVLFNGRRTIQAPGDGFTDTNLIPFFALSQIEILKDGAAATYGSDAIAGVANFITQRDYEGVVVQGDYELIDGSNGNWTASVLAGHNFGKLNILAGFGWQHRSELGTTARKFTRTTYQQNPSGWSALGTPGLFAATYLQNGVPATTVRPEAGCAGVGGVQDGSLCRFSFVPFDNLIEEEDRYQAYLQADIDLSDRLHFHAEGMYSQTDLDSLGYSPSFPPTQGPRGSGSANAFTVSPNNPGVPAFLAQNGLLPSTPERPLAAITAVFWRPLGWLGNPLDPVKGSGRGAANNKAWRFSGGLEYELNDKLQVQFYGTYWRSEREAFAPDMVSSRLQNALNGLGGPDCNPATGTPGAGGCQWFNPFVNAGPSNPALGIANPLYVPGAENKPGLVRFIQVPVGTRQVEEQFVADLVFSGETNIDLGGGAIGYAFGAQYRSNLYTSRPLNTIGDLALNPCFREGDLSCVGTPTEGVGPFIFLGGSRRDRQSQNVYALFAEVKVPITENLEVTGAARFENYGNPIGSTFNPKGSVRWNPFDWLVLRGSVGTTFKAPLATQVSTNFVTALAGIQAAANNFKSQDIFGNPTDLGPERALTYNIGAVVSVSGLTASIDYWSFDFKDRITTTPVQAIASAVASGAVSPNGTRFANCSNVFADLVTFQGGCVQGVTTGFDISRVRTDWVNGPRVKTRGIDVALDYRTDLGPGRFSTGVQASYVLDYTFGNFIFRGQLVQAGYKARGFTNYFRDPGTISKLRATAYVNYAISGLNARYQVRYVDGVKDDRCVGLANCASTSFGPTNFGATVGSFTQHDITFSYDLPIDSVKAQLQFGIENFTNADPPASRLEVSYDPFIGNPFGRIFRFGVRAGF